MAFGDVWNRTLVYFGIAEEDDEWDEDGYVTEEELEQQADELTAQQASLRSQATALEHEGMHGPLVLDPMYRGDIGMIEL